MKKRIGFGLAGVLLLVLAFWLGMPGPESASVPGVPSAVPPGSVDVGDDSSVAATALIDESSEQPAAWFELDALPLESYPDLRQAWEETTELSRRDELMREMMATLSKFAPDRALAFYDELRSRNDAFSRRDAYTAVKAISEYLGALDPERVAAWIETLPPEHQYQAAHNLILQWAQLDLAATGQWVLERPSGEAFSVAVRSFHQALRAYASDAEASAWAARATAREEAADHGRVIAYEWARADVASAFDWAQSLPAVSAQDDALEGIVEALAEDEASAAMTWVERFPAGSLRDRATARVVTEWARQDAPTVARWVDSRRTDPAYQGWVSTVFLFWEAKDPQAARAWLDQSDLRPDLREYFSRLRG